MDAINPKEVKKAISVKYSTVRYGTRKAMGNAATQLFLHNFANYNHGTLCPLWLGIITR